LAVSRRALTVGELNACCPIDLSVVSRHLATLRDAGVVRSEKRGREVYYTVRCGPLAELLRGVARALDNCAAHGCETEGVES
jgi:ArsR family transcriptional regulator